MSSAAQTANPPTLFPPETLYRGHGQVGLAIGGWTFSFNLREIGLPILPPEQIYQGQLLLLNGSTGASIAVSHLTGGVQDLASEIYVLGFSGMGVESLHGGPKSSQFVHGVLVVNRTTGRANGELVFDDAKHVATAEVQCLHIAV